MLTLSLVMIPWDWIGSVTIRRETRSIRWISGRVKISPGRVDEREPDGLRAPVR
jgi:hypothetical protein